MKIEQVYKIRHIANIRNNLVVMINNISENEHIILEYNKHLGCGSGTVYIDKGEELFDLVLGYYQKELAKIDEEIENL